MFSPKSLCPVSRFRIRPTIRTAERSHASTLGSYLRVRILPPQVEPSPGTIHSLLVVERKSPARKYRRRTGNGGAQEKSTIDLGRQQEGKSRVGNSERNKIEKKTEPGRFAEGPRQPRLILPASAVSEQETRKNFSRLARNSPTENRFKILQKAAGFFFAAKSSGVSRREAGNFPSLQNFISPAKLYFSSSPRRNS